MYRQSIEERIKQYRTCLLIHSYLYYALDAPIITDEVWQQGADQLVALQSLSGASIGFYDEEFRDWDGSTGFHLPQDAYVANKAAMVATR